MIIKGAIENCRPLMLLQKVKVGSVTYYVPVPVSESRSYFEAIRWIHKAGEYYTHLWLVEIDKYSSLIGLNSKILVVVSDWWKQNNTDLWLVKVDGSETLQLLVNTWSRSRRVNQGSGSGMVWPRSVWTRSIRLAELSTLCTSTTSLVNRTEPMLTIEELNNVTPTEIMKNIK